MRHLYASTVKAEQALLGQTDGEVTGGWAPAGNDAAEKALLARIDCRLDLNFVRPGKDAPPAVQAGQAPERFGIMFCGPEYLGHLRSGMRLVTIPNARGKEPISGVFDIRAIPDAAMDFSDAHHIEVQVFEVVQRKLTFEWPDASGSYEVV